MITGQLKNKIDAIWDTFFAAGITTPLTVVEQITYLLFIKLLDDNQIKKEASANIFGTTVKNAIFKDGNWHNPETEKDVPYKNLRWSVFKNLDTREMYNLMRNDVFVFIKNINTGKDSSYSKFMQNAIFMIPNERTLARVVEGINGLDLNDKDAMGDVYEYILGKMASSGINGQFRTPRHIIRMMVELMQPTLKDVICDPAMGSAGFIVESAKYVSEHYENELLKQENQEKYANSMFYGFDTDQTMLRIGAMNMMLHGVENPNIEQRDSLSEDNTDKDKYTMVLANPPFAGSLEYADVSKDILALTRTKKTEILFLSLFTRILKIGGRCASIVPDGITNNTNDSAYTTIRKELVENQKLEAVISMPSGVFQPYAGVSTAILIFTKTNAGGTDKVWFYNMKADGYQLSKKRTPIKEDDIPDIINRFRNLEAEESRTRKDQSFFVSKEDIVKNNYVLNINDFIETEKKEIEIESPQEIMKDIDKLDEELATLKQELKDLLGV